MKGLTFDDCISPPWGSMVDNPNPLERTRFVSLKCLFFPKEKFTCAQLKKKKSGEKNTS